DPFYHPTADGVLVEALRSSTGLGEIVHVSAGGAAALSDGRGHYSYPATFSQGSEHHVLPEMSEWSAPKLFRLGETRLKDAGFLDVPGSPRLLDPTLYAADGTIFLFANDSAEGGSVLRLWVSEALSATFREHPCSPICVSPAGARMAGAILESGGVRLRFGQDGRREYGDGIILFRIEQLSPDVYREAQLGEFRFGHVRGPHTVNFKSGNFKASNFKDWAVVFDFYANRPSILAGPRRLRSLLTRR
ncbi:MAG TPA: hypothetical protein VFU87_03605, partial [Sphingomicrobium sp.]|nr:hypothetical protein [Sphingomicrobium sp.]